MKIEIRHDFRVSTQTASPWRRAPHSMVDTNFRRIAIIGLGLIGGSWGLALKKRGFKGPVVGCDRPDIVRRALAAGAIDESGEDVAAAVRGAGLIILATPVGAILELLPKLKAAASPQALISDVGSTKRLICERAQQALGESPLFLGGHPLAGKESSGFDHADPALFENARYALTPLTPDHLADDRVKAFSSLLVALGARPFISDAASHDRAVAFLSHLPQLMASGLASLIAEQSAEDFLPLELAASGFRDVTRLAESPYSLWRDICLTNIENIRVAVESLIEKLETMKEHLSDRELEREFKQASKLREQLRGLRGAGKP